MENFETPVEYINSLAWDKTPRIYRVLHDYLGAGLSMQSYVHLKDMLVGAVNRSLNPGCEIKSFLLLVGGQGTGKSTFVRKLGLNWHADFTGNPEDLFDVREACSKWVVEIPEISGLTKREFQKLKCFISKTSYIDRNPYEPSETLRRRCTFVCTTNGSLGKADRFEDELFDYVPIAMTAPTKSIWAIPKAEIDQIWAEAFEEYKNQDLC